MAALRSSRPTRQGVSKFGSPLQLAGETSNAGNDPKSNIVTGGPSRRLTQEDQDKADQEKEQEAMRDLIQTWSDRLQLISVITTFFASTEVGLLGKTLPSSSNGISITGQVANIGLTCAFVLHLFAAIISFIAAFFLIRYKLSVAEKEEKAAETELVDSPTSLSTKDPEKSPYADELRTDPFPGRVRVTSPPSTGNQIIWSTNPHLVQVGPFRIAQPPTLLLSRCLSLCVFLSSIGFILALMGVITFAWDQLPLSISIFSSVSLGFCLVAGFVILIAPSTKISHIYYGR